MQTNNQKKAQTTRKQKSPNQSKFCLSFLETDKTRLAENAIRIDSWYVPYIRGTAVPQKDNGVTKNKKIRC